MAKRGENIYLRSDGRWEGKYVRDKTDGKIHYGYVSGGSYDEVYLRKKAKILELAREESSILIISTTVRDVSDRWLKSRKGMLKETTCSKYDSILRNHILPEFGDRTIRSISRDEVREWLDHYQKSGGKDGESLSAKTMNGISSVLRLIFLYATEAFGISTDDLDDLSMRQTKNPIEILSLSEQELLEDFLLENLDLSNLGILSCLYTGVRLGEICALHWGDIKRKDGVLDIHATMERVKSEEGADTRTRIIITPPKSNCSIRRIPIPDSLLALMDTESCEDETFFLTGHKKNYVDPRTMENRFKSVLKKTGIAPVKFHSLRHTFATRCIEKGFDVKSLSEILGHASVAITMNRYVHPTMIQKKDYMNRLSFTHNENT